jgi:hypothetical protein
MEDLLVDFFLFLDFATNQLKFAINQIDPLAKYLGSHLDKVKINGYYVLATIAFLEITGTTSISIDFLLEDVLKKKRKRKRKRSFFSMLQNII